MDGFFQTLKMQRWDDHRYYHHSRINQSLHLVSALSFLCAYVLMFKDPVAAALVGWLGTRQSMPKALVMIVIAGNAAWTIASIALLFSGAVTPNLLGEAFVAIQAVAVGALAELQYIGLRKSGGAVAA